jgi:hypothetical protein
MAPVALHQPLAVTLARLKDDSSDLATADRAIDPSVFSRPNLALWVTQDHRHVRGP